MPVFTITRGLNIRRYFDIEVEADTPEAAFAAGQAMILSDNPEGWTPSRFGHAPLDDLTEPTTGANESLSVVDPDGEVMIDFTDVPNADEPAGYSALLNFARQVANVEAWRDRCAREYAEEMEDQGGDATDIETVEDRIEHGEKSFDYLDGCDAVLEELITTARAMLAFPKTETEG